MNLDHLGWNPELEAALKGLKQPNLLPGRVAAEHRTEFRLYTEAGELPAILPGRLRHRAEEKSELPVVGDWVAFSPLQGEVRVQIQAVLPRHSRFSRKAAGARTEEQIIAANVDTLFVVTAMGGEVNPRGLERYLSLAWESGAAPVLVLTKADLCPEPEAWTAKVRALAPGVPVQIASGRTGEGVEELLTHFRGHHTGAMVGASGVGKSTLINRLLGQEAMKTGDVREDGKGRHTTSHRELLLLPGGGLIIDTPGMRELQLWDTEAGLADAFSDIEELVRACRFNDCSHEREPGCAVMAALESGALDAGRFAGWRKLRAELRHLDVRQDQRAKLVSKRETVARQKSLNKVTRRNPKR
jgi:ribosome biogenesis GTPase